MFPLPPRRSAPQRPARRVAWAPACLAAALLAGAHGATLAQARPGSTPGASGIYTCIDDRGRRLTADRPIAECVAKEQQVLNRDGSLRRIHPPTLTAEEKALQEQRERRAAEQRAAQQESVRRDRNLMARYPNEAAHLRAREAALDTVRLAMKATEIRLRTLAAERKPLLDESEFYVGRALPAKLRTALDANDASTAAQQEAAANQDAELDRINRLYDAELHRLRLLWAGAPPGSLGPMPSASAPAAMAGSAPGVNAAR